MGGPLSSKTLLTTSTAISTPAQKPLGLANKTFITFILGQARCPREARGKTRMTKLEIRMTKAGRAFGLRHSSLIRASDFAIRICFSPFPDFQRGRKMRQAVCRVWWRFYAYWIDQLRVPAAAGDGRRGHVYVSPGGGTGKGGA